MAGEFFNRNPIPEVLTPVYRAASEKVHNPNVVKTLLAANWPSHSTYWVHVGIYGYRAHVLTRWPTLSYPPFEHSEKLEQPRLIEAGIQIGTFEVEPEFLSIDNPEQPEQARGIASAMNL